MRCKSAWAQQRSNFARPLFDAVPLVKPSVKNPPLTSVVKNHIFWYQRKTDLLPGVNTAHTRWKDVVAHHITLVVHACCNRMLTVEQRAVMTAYLSMMTGET